MQVTSTQFVNTLPYIRNPIEEFHDFRFVDWDSGIYPKFKGPQKRSEVEFYSDIITKNGLRDMIDLGVGGGSEVSGILDVLHERGYPVNSVEANEVSDDFIAQASSLFYRKKQNVLVHKANWIDLPRANPQYEHKFEFAFLTGNSLTYIGGGSREYTKKAQQSIVGKFAQLIEPGGYLFIDTRNYDYIRSLMNLPKEEIFDKFSFDYTVMYHGNMLVFPGYISETVVVLHYYDIENKKWGTLDLYPIYHSDMLDIISKDFTVEKVYHDFEDGSKNKSLFIQYLCRRR